MRSVLYAVLGIATIFSWPLGSFYLVSVNSGVLMVNLTKAPNPELNPSNRAYILPTLPTPSTLGSFTRTTIAYPRLPLVDTFTVLGNEGYEEGTGKIE